MMQRREAEHRQFLASLGFDWQTSPRIEHGLMHKHPMVPPPSLSITMRDGRAMILRQLHQYYAHGGVLAGLPHSPVGDFESALATAKRVFPNWSARPLLLEPVLHTGYMRTDDEGRPVPYMATWVAPVCCIGLFESDALAHDPASIFSSAILVWFQDAYGIPTDPRTLEQMANVDWDRIAEGWSP